MRTKTSTLPILLVLPVGRASSERFFGGGEEFFRVERRLAFAERVEETFRFQDAGQAVQHPEINAVGVAAKEEKDVGQVVETAAERDAATRDPEREEVFGDDVRLRLARVQNRDADVERGRRHFFAFPERVGHPVGVPKDSGVGGEFRYIPNNRFFRFRRKVEVDRVFGENIGERRFFVVGAGVRRERFFELVVLRLRFDDFGFHPKDDVREREDPFALDFATFERSVFGEFLELFRLTAEEFRQFVERVRALHRFGPFNR